MSAAPEDHELVRAFAAQELALNATLVEMLNEHFSHRTERRGCGFTQASRHLAVLVNRPREERATTLADLFPVLRACRRDATDDVLSAALRRVPPLLAREESHLLAALIVDLAMPAAKVPGVEELAPTFDELKIGTCPLAEKYFLEIADRFVRRKGRANILVSQTGAPLLIEKLNLGDNHSCINVAELMLNGVRVPPGCLFGVHYEGDVSLRPNRSLPGSVIPIGRCAGFRFLRVTTLAVSPPHRARAFTAHFEAQLEAGLFAPGQTTIEQLRRVAEAEL